MGVDIEKLKVDESLWPDGQRFAVISHDGVFVAWTNTKTTWPDPVWHLIPRPTTKQWDGESDPAYGQLAQTSGGRCVVVGYDAIRKRVAVQWCDGELGVVVLQAVKPIKSAAEREKEETIKQAHEVKSDLPPVGTTNRNSDLYIDSINPQPHVWEVVAHRGGEAIVYIPADEDDESAAVMLTAKEFKSAKEDRERAATIDVAIASLGQLNAKVVDHWEVLGTLYDAGMLRKREG
ncbi:hypothetical protein RE428_32370 [Marinobacter nanhaiticus D15-8W]|uniref:Uncharacterized protein n=1 Tax=Marinobacter nanhaiticus D15-8W TaxID=626887 RepID=N6X0F8_9GAMM|nr:hypothetical protein [Marinobacter nanhaiticus]ENO16927.1 hypothetical protein J057_01945 [Marinobacter nanhaiticus D15-8W]BES72219.1 hypothetical protein RE428_32370 [Marinobacter nanhaiticus D15-8W]